MTMSTDEQINRVLDVLAWILTDKMIEVKSPNTQWSEWPFRDGHPDMHKLRDLVIAGWEFRLAK